MGICPYATTFPVYGDPLRMERRTFLASVSATVPLALAGCMGGQDEPSNTTTEQTDTTDTADTTGTTETTTENSEQSGPLALGEEVSLSGDRAFATLDADASAFVVTRGRGDDRIHAVADERYVTVKFAPTGVSDYETFVEENVALTLNGEEEFGDPVFPIGGGPNRFDAAYSIPTDLTPYTATVSLETGDGTVEWEFDARDIETISQSVDYEVGSLSAPDSVPAGEDFTAELHVDNGGEAITFYAVVEDTAHAPTLVSEDLPASEETVIEIDATAPDTDEDAFEFTVDWDHGEDSVSVPIE
jgi:hypothetical protein